MGWVISIDSSSRWEVKKRIVDRVDGLIRKNRISIQSRGISRYLVWIPGMGVHYQDYY